MSIVTDLQKLSGGAWVELFELDASDVGGTLYRFHCGTNEYYQPVVWQGQTYTPWEIQADGFGYSGTGAPPRPKLRASNVTGILSALLKETGDLLGAKLTRKRTMVKFLDAANFVSGNPTADPLSALPDEIFYVVQKTAENRLIIELELGTASDLTGAGIPKQSVLLNCRFRYRGNGCGYAGGPVADYYDQPTTDPAKDACSHKTSGCKLRFGANADLPFGGFPGAGMAQRY